MIKSIIHFGSIFLLTIQVQAQNLPVPAFQLTYPGDPFPIDYTLYGKFSGINTENYSYVVSDPKKLSEAVGEGVFPNQQAVISEPFKKLKEEGKMGGSHWDYVNHSDKMLAYYKWASANEEPGVKQFFTAEALKEAGLIEQAIKAYYATIIHFPGSACFAADKSYVWYVAPIAIDRINYLTRQYPQLGYQLVDASVIIRNEKDTDLSNDKVIVNPGKFVQQTGAKDINLSSLKIINKRGEGKVQLINYENGHWEMRVDGIPFTVKGVTYGPTKIGESPHNKSIRNWMFTDDNQNGKADSPYDAYIDLNSNNRYDKDEMRKGDFQILKEMGCNAIRHYHVSKNDIYDGKSEFDKQVLRDMYNTYGIGVVLGDFLGAYTVGSGASWEKGTDYTDPEQKARMKEIVRQMVLDHKDEPYVLMWLLGNENNMPGTYDGVNATRTNASTQPEAYAKFLNEVAEMIHELDKDHPVAVGNVEIHLLEYYDKYAPAIDILGVNAYRGKNGFGGLFRDAGKTFDRPVLITEFGSDCYNSKEKSYVPDTQADYLKYNWEDIDFNKAGKGGEGNAIGGIVFQYLDEWWKSLKGPSSVHDTLADSPMPFQDGYSSEEWFGIFGQGAGKDSPYLREMRPAYQVLKELWTK